ncbi:MAG: TIGR04086 family membrane protein [Ruminococcus sp.]|nr:TIGR04086 family membrane protein [Ruminococcus sp.]
MRTTDEERAKYENLRIVITAAFAFAAVVFVLSAVFAAITAALDVSDKTIALMGSFALCAGCFACAFVTAKQKHRGGLLCGAAVGAVIFLAVLFFGVIMGGAFTAGGFFSKVLIIFICSLMGGLVGVNTEVRG